MHMIATAAPCARVRVLFLLSWLLRWTDFFAFFYSESSAISYIQHLFLYLAWQNTYTVKAQPLCPPHLPLPRNFVPPLQTTSSINILVSLLCKLHRRPRVMHVINDTQVSERKHKLTFLSMTTN